ncbi:START domain-containing protein [Vibrio hangzhouensis]|uniref:START domain-containing protein n=2 Tax=Vibrio hangzhouensis TaxID=462991 RepID=A0A1H5S9Z5_9VIBR|nr:START domain-containing protein [Vibrio hangzhouensis]
MDVLRIIMLFSTLLLTGSLSAEESRYWQFDSNIDGITIYTREHTDGLVEIRAQMFTPTTYSAFLTLLEDSENVPNWIDNTSHSQVLRQISVNENIVYTQFKAPWPVRDRDMVTYSKYWVDDFGFTLKIHDAPEPSLAKQNGYIRITSVEASWTLQKLTNGTTLIEYKAYADPGGLLPAWLINKLSTQSARATFNNLRNQLPKYQRYSHPHMRE